MVKIVNGERIKTGGRRKGVPNKKSAAFRQAQIEAARQLGEVISGAFEGDSYALLCAIYKDPRFDLGLRLNAAKIAIGYERPALSSIDAKVSGEVGHYIAVPTAERDALPPME